MMAEFDISRYIKESIYILSGHLKDFKYSYKSSLHITAGNRNNSNASLNNAGSNGNYWTSSVDGTNSRNLNFNSSSANFNSSHRANGFTVRCVLKNL